MQAFTSGKYFQFNPTATEAPFLSSERAVFIIVYSQDLDFDDPNIQNWNYNLTANMLT